MKVRLKPADVADAKDAFIDKYAIVLANPQVDF
jgi:hypothetical protein